MGEMQLRLIERGERTVVVDEDEYRQAVEAGELDTFLDPFASDIPTDYVVVDRDGMLHEPTSLWPQSRPSLLGADATGALARVIGQAPVMASCHRCDYSTACPQHIAEYLVALARREDLIVMPAEEADRVVRAAARDNRVGSVPG